MKPTLLLLAALSLALTGCANLEYKQYLDTTTKLETAAITGRSAEAVAKSNENAAKYRAMADIAASGGEASKVSAMMAIALGEQRVAGSTHAAATVQIAPPPTNQVLQWASVIVPGLTNVLGMRYNYLSTAAQSNNAASVAISTNSTFASMAGKIQAPAANITTTTTSTLSGTGVMGNGSYTTNANPTLNGTGVIGNGTYSNPITNTTTNDNHQTNPVTIIPAGKVCTVNPLTYVTTCQ